MKHKRIFLSEPLAPNTTMTIRDDKHHYIARVMRAKVGQKLIVFSGNGQDYLAEIQSIDKKSTTLLITDEVITTPESPTAIHLHQALIKSDKLDWVIQKSVELGVASIQGFFSERSEMKIDGKRLGNKMSHWQGIIEHALMQSGRSQMVQLNAPSSLSHALVPQACHLTFHPKATHGWNDLPQADNYHLWIGPEGGFSDAELEAMQQKNALILPLGPRILRAETAAITAIALLQALKGDLL